MDGVKRLAGSLRFRLPLLVMAVALPAVVLVVWNDVERRADAKHAAQEQALQVARNAAGNYESAVTGAAQLVSPIAAIFGFAESLDGISGDVCVAFFAPLLDPHAGLPYIGVANSDGDMVCTSQEGAAGQNIIDQPYIPRALDSNSFTVSRFHTNDVTGQQVISVAKSIRNSNGDLTGVVYVDVAVESLTPAAAVNELPIGSFARITDQNGTITARYPAAPELIGTSISNRTEIELALSEGSGTYEGKEIFGKTALMSFSTINLGDGELAGIIIVGTPSSVVYGPINDLLIRNLAILSAVTAAALLAGWLLSGPIVFRPLSRLEAAAENVTRGDLSGRIGPNYPSGEFGKLARAFDLMTQSVQTREAEIRSLNSTLEARVIERTEQLELANKELEAFSYSVSHDLRAPIRAIDGFSRILIEDHADELSPEAQRFLGLVMQSSVTMTSLIDDLLHFSRIGRSSMTRRDSSLDGVAQDALDEVRAEMGEREIEFKFGELGTANIDPALMKRVYANLLSNAIKFTRKTDRARVEVGKSERNGKSVYFVKDNGAGFDMKYADKLFGVFQRLHHPEEFEGTGVGLATAQRVILRHNGEIWADATVDKGASFFFTIGPDSNEGENEETEMNNGG